MKDIVSLGQFDPGFVHGYESYYPDQCSVWKDAVRKRVNDVGEDVLPVSYDMSYIGADIRNPEWHVDSLCEASRDEVIVQWHHDNAMGTENPQPYAADQWLVVWANIRPTEIQMRDGSIFTGDPGEIIAFRNGSYKHRTPEMTADEAASRWFARSYLMPIPPAGYKVSRDEDGMERYEVFSTPGFGVLDLGVVQTIEKVKGGKWRLARK